MFANTQDLAKVRYSRAGRILFTFALGLGFSLSAQAPNPKKSRIIRVRDAEATRFLTPNRDRVRAMLDHALPKVTGQTTPRAAWRTLVTPTDVIGLKVDAQHGPMAGTRPALVEAVARSLIAAGIPVRQIVIWDSSLEDLRKAGYARMAKTLGVRLAGAREAGYESHPHFDVTLTHPLQPGDRFFGKPKDAQLKRLSHLSKLLTRELTCIINLHPLIAHPVTGSRGHLDALGLDSVDNTSRFEKSPHHRRLAVPNLFLMAAYSRTLPPARVAAALKPQGNARALLLQPTSGKEFFYYNKTSDEAMPLARALRDALKVATAHNNTKAQAVLVLDEITTWRQYLLPHGGTVLGAHQLRTDRTLPAPRVRLCITDALLCQFHLADTRRADYATTLNELWVGTDPVALDMMAAERIIKLRQFVKLPTRTEANEMRRAAGHMGMGVTRLEDVEIIDLPALPSKNRE
jgi:hypothetical protein